jgi:hypothetical protein
MAKKKKKATSKRGPAKKKAPAKKRNAARKKTTKKTPRRRQPLTLKKRETFLRALAETSNVTHSATLVKMSRQRMYQIRDEDPDFAEAWADAEQQAADNLEAEAWRRGHEGIKEPLHYQGELTGDFVQKYSDTLLIFLLKGARPDKYRDFKSVDHTTGGKPFEAERKRHAELLKQMSTEDLEAIEEIYARAAAAADGEG